MLEFNPSRRVALGLGAAALPLVLAACGNEEDTESASGGSDAGGGSPAGFPASVETLYGTVTVEQRPQRVVALGGSYADQLIALGVQPVAYVGSPRAGEDFAAAYPWLAVTDLDPANHDLSLLAEGYAPSLEAVAAYEPDLILGDGADWAIDETMYEEMSLIAPTYCRDFTEDGPHPSEWPAMFADIAALTGTSDLTDGILSELDRHAEEARDALSGLQGATYIWGDIREQEMVLSGDIHQMDLLGLTTDAALAERGTISLENLDELTSDVLAVMVWRGDDVQEDLEADPRYAELPSVQGGTVMPLDAVVTNATEVGPRAQHYWLDHAVSTLEDSAMNTEGA